MNNNINKNIPAKTEIIVLPADEVKSLKLGLQFEIRSETVAFSTGFIGCKKSKTTIIE